MLGSRPHDQLIDLRIALEALYGGRGPELAFRVSTCGARHLGRDLDERRHYRDLLAKAYSTASRIIHAGEVKGPSVAQSLKDGLDACRKGVLKCLEEGRIPNSDELLLGP